MNCDPLTVSFLDTTFHSKDFYFCKKWTPLLKNTNRITPKIKKDTNLLLLDWILDQIKPSQSEEKRAEASLPDVKQSAPELVIDRISSPDLGNVETHRDNFRRCYNCVTAPLCSHLVIFLEKNTQTTKSLKQTFFNYTSMYGMS